MKRAPPQNRNAGASPQVQPTPEHAELALREAAILMAPTALWLLRNGVSYPAFAELLKSVFVEAARDELDRADTKTTQSALSLLSGVHRKDVRDLDQAPTTRLRHRRPTLSSQVFTRWLHDSHYRGKDGKPRALLRTGAGRSFEALCREVSNDVHPRSILDELLRLGQVGLDGERVVVLADTFVPSPRLDEMTALFSSNVSDHAAASVSNLTTSAPRFLEQSIYADGLTPESIELLHAAARQAWGQAFQTVIARARDRVDRDKSSDGEHRMRFGAYFFSETVAPVPPALSSRRKKAVAQGRAGKKNPP